MRNSSMGVPCIKSQGLTVGLDLGDKHIQACFLDAEGNMVEESRLATTATALRGRFLNMKPCRIAIEAGTHSPWVSRLLKECGHEVLVANPRKLRMISQSDSKNDKMDARWLARMARVDPNLLHSIQHRGKETQTDLALLRAREALVRTRTLLANHVRGAVKSFGGHVPRCSTESLDEKGLPHIPEGLLPALNGVLTAIGNLTTQIHELDSKIEEMTEKKYPAATFLRQVKGVGPLTSIGFILTLEDPSRFRKSRTVGAYLGLRPRQRDSGSQNPQLRITKSGDNLLRKLLVQSAHHILGRFGPDSDLRRWGLTLAERGGKNAKKRAVVAVARRLSVLLHHLWRSGEVYEPLRNTLRKTKSVKLIPA